MKTFDKLKQYIEAYSSEEYGLVEVKLLTELSTEIERLTEDCESADAVLEAQRHLIDLIKKDKAELQKQVEKLTEQRNKNYLKGEIIMKDKKNIMDEIKEQCEGCEAWSGTDCTRNPYTQGCLKDEKQVIECHGMLKGCDMVKQAVKDTAKEILQQLLDFTNYETFRKGYELVKIRRKIQEMAKRKGVEVE